MSVPEPQTTAEARAREALQAAIEGLYETFASYPLRPRGVGCACCVSPEDEARLHSRPLRELTADNLDGYAWAAVLTLGDQDDFRHFPPRLFELATFERFGPIDLEIVVKGLAYAGWRAWPEGEQAALDAYLSALWRYVLVCCGPFTSQSQWTADECLCSIAQAIDDLAPFLSLWRDSRELSARHHVGELVNCDGRDTLPDRLVDAFWEARQAQMQQVIDWLLEPAALAMLRQALDQAPEEFVPELSEAAERLAHLQARRGGELHTS